jgi:hypothetical protein
MRCVHSSYEPTLAAPFPSQTPHRPRSVTQWFESKELQKSNPKEEERIADILQADLRVASEQLVKARRSRLRELYAAELRQWQDELAAIGLAIPSAGPGTE